MEILHINYHIEISYDPSTQVLFCQWIGFQNREDIMKAGFIILGLIKERGIEKILNNNTEVSGPWNDAAEWIRTEWFPAIIAAGVRHFAWVISGNPFAELSAKKAMPSTAVIKEFDNYQEAYSWITSM